MIDAEVTAAAAIERLIGEKLTVKDIVQLTGLDQATVRRLRQLSTDEAGAAAAAEDASSSATEVCGA